MKTVPSLVASSTIGAAATGFVFAHPQDSSHPRPTSNKRKATECEGNIHRFSAPPLRPNTSSAVVTPNRFYPGTASDSSPWPSSEDRPLTSRKESPREPRNEIVNGHTPNASRDTSGSSRPNQSSHESRDSASNRSSWYKRLSARPLSQAGTQPGSPRSSVGPDSPSVTFSQVSSAAPILSPGGNPSQLPPNKLVKPAPLQRDTGFVTLSRNVSRAQAPTLRRPATSHQRSATLQQRFKEDELAAMRRPITQHNNPTSNQNTPPPLSTKSPTPTRLRLHFDARPTRTTKEKTLGRKAGALSRSPTSGNKRVLPDITKRPILVKPSMLSNDVIETTIEYYFYDKESSYVGTPAYSETPMDNSFPTDEADEANEDDSEDSLKQPRRSLSMQFNAQPTWIRRSSSVRSDKRSQMMIDADKRYSSAPVPSTSKNVHEDRLSSIHVNNRLNHQSILRRRVSAGRTGRHHHLILTGGRTRSRHNSSPLPPLPQLSNPNLDLSGEALPSTSPGVFTPNPLSPLQPESASLAFGSGQKYFPFVSSPRASSNGSRSFNITPSERDSTLIGSDFDGRGFVSGEEDDLDFQSDTVFDSFRTGATGGGQRNAPLDTMFDETPPSNGPKAKIAPLHELMALGVFRENGDRILEEDEDMLTPVKNGLKSRHTSPNKIDVGTFPSSPLELPSDDFGRLSLEDEDEDEDWTKDEENLAIHSPLSPPSSSLSSSRVSPSLRAALADLTNGGSSDRKSTPSPLKLKQNVFDWAEPSSNDKLNLNGNSPRPKTAHAKQLADGRGGRAMGRRGPSALHIRSQSVPVVPDLAAQRDATHAVNKFGTWGLGAKGVSEDWDNDFEFEGMDTDGADKSNKKPNSMVMQVPEAIQASQANVVGHVSQIREICLLVEDLKRLRGLAREKGIMYGPTAPLWAEAEGIIALAIPDEDDLALSPPGSPTSTRFRRDSLDPKFADWGVDAEDVSRPEKPIEVLDGQGRPTGNTYDGRSVRKGSVFSPDDDIFGSTTVSNRRGSIDELYSPKSATFPQPNSKDSAAIARSVMEIMHQHRANSDPLLSSSPAQSTSKMPFDTTSLRDLVSRASSLSRTLAEIIRKHDRITSSFSDSPSPKRNTDKRPAFTRVFTDPLESASSRLPRSQSNNSILSGSLDSSPSRSLGQRMHMMTVV